MCERLSVHVLGCPFEDPLGILACADTTPLEACVEATRTRHQGREDPARAGGGGGVPCHLELALPV